MESHSQTEAKNKNELQWKRMKEHVWSPELNIGARRDQPDRKLVQWLRTIIAELERIKNRKISSNSSKKKKAKSVGFLWRIILWRCSVIATIIFVALAVVFKVRNYSCRGFHMGQPSCAYDLLRELLICVSLKVRVIAEKQPKVRSSHTLTGQASGSLKGKETFFSPTRI